MIFVIFVASCFFVAAVGSWQRDSGCRFCRPLRYALSPRGHLIMANDETARVAALRRYRILDTEPEQQFDDLTLLASQVCGTPIALISLVDECRQWFKSRVGTTVGETSRSVSFCAYALGRPDLLIIPDARDDERFRDNPMVTGEPNVRFYAGAPLTSREGFTLGTLCVIDSVPRTLTDGQAAALQALRRQVEGQPELRRSLIELEAALAERDLAEEAQRQLNEELRAALETSASSPRSFRCRTRAGSTW